MSVPPYAITVYITLLVAFILDKLKARGLIILCTMPIAIIRYTIIVNIGNEHPKVKYGITIITATGIYSSVPPNLT